MWWEAHQVETLGSAGAEKRGAARARRQEEVVWLGTNVTSGGRGKKITQKTDKTNWNLPNRKNVNW